jgi:hypothetical protein
MPYIIFAIPTHTNACPLFKPLGSNNISPDLVLASSSSASKSPLRQADVGSLPLGPSSNGSSSSSAFCSTRQTRTQAGKGGEFDRHREGEESGGRLLHENRPFPGVRLL